MRTSRRKGSSILPKFTLRARARRSLRPTPIMNVRLKKYLAEDRRDLAEDNQIGKLARMLVNGAFSLPTHFPTPFVLKTETKVFLSQF